MLITVLFLQNTTMLTCFWKFSCDIYSLSTLIRPKDAGKVQLFLQQYVLWELHQLLKYPDSCAITVFYCESEFRQNHNNH